LRYVISERPLTIRKVSDLASAGWEKIEKKQPFTSILTMFKRLFEVEKGPNSWFFTSYLNCEFSTIVKDVENQVSVGILTGIIRATGLY